MGRFESGRCDSGSVPKFDSMDGFTVQGTGNGVGISWSERSCEDTGNGVCTSWSERSCEDTGNRVCGSSRDMRVSSLWRGVVSLRDWWATRVSVVLGIEAVAALYGSGHWKSGVSESQSVALRSRVLLGIWSGNEGWLP